MRFVFVLTQTPDGNHVSDVFWAENSGIRSFTDIKGLVDAEDEAPVEEEEDTWETLSEVEESFNRMFSYTVSMDLSSKDETKKYLGTDGVELLRMAK